MKAADFGVTDDPYRQAQDDVAPYRGLTPQECWRRFIELTQFSEMLMRTRPVEEWKRLLQIHDALDNPGRWWERVPNR
jgi:hypothetical protein